ncbi:MAG: hypothetical protein CMJ19_17995 [Phycisphaeraceae bacterium]|nr:hypothetical protein [Phycisphaeraceae bacterium]
MTQEHEQNKPDFFERMLDGVDMQQIADRPPRKSNANKPRRIMRRVDDSVKDVRANVKDAAQAVATWVASVVNHDTGQTQLNEILDHCLRPGPQLDQINYTALAQEINQSMHTDLSPRRVQTAIQHLRAKRQPATMTDAKPKLQDQLNALHQDLQTNHQLLVAESGDDQANLHRRIGTEILAIVRVAAGRLIENDFGEGIAQDIDIDDVESRFLDFVKDAVTEHQGNTLTRDLHKLLVDLCDYDGSATCDMRLVVNGSRVVCDLLDPDSLPGVMAQLNVLVAGRHILDSELYVTELSRLSEAAYALKNDDATQTYLNWVKRQSTEQRVPSPVRVSSYCLNNLATHVYDRIFTGELTEPANWMPKADDALNKTRQRDSGFDLIPVTELVGLVAHAHLRHSPEIVREHLQQLGESKTIDLLIKLIRFDNCQQLVTEAREHALAVYPQINQQITPALDD